MWDILLFEDMEGSALVTDLQQDVLPHQVYKITPDRFLTDIGTQFPVFLVSDALAAQKTISRP